MASRCVGGLDGVAGLVEQSSDVADAPVDGFGADAEQGGDGDLGQGEPVVEEGGQEPVGEGEDGAAAGAGAGLAGAVAAAFVQLGFPLVVVQGGERGDQGVPLGADSPVRAGWHSQARSGLGWSNGSGAAPGSAGRARGAGCSSSRRASRGG